MRFKVGDIVTLWAKTRSFGATDGATATITEVTRDYIYVLWIKENLLCNEQKNGRYAIDDFRLVKQAIKPYGICAFVTNYYK